MPAKNFYALHTAVYAVGVTKDLERSVILSFINCSDPA